jgi:WhiB family redox-sensing transcriptional regulator
MTATQEEIINETKVVLAADVAWRAEARCDDSSGSLVGLFFSDELQDIAAAKGICARCPVIAPCLEGAIERREPWGVWGGQLFLNGRVLASKRRRGRPPKVARPEDELPDVPVPAHLLERLRTA